MYQKFPGLISSDQHPGVNGTYIRKKYNRLMIPPMGLEKVVKIRFQKSLDTVSLKGQ